MKKAQPLVCIVDDDASICEAVCQLVASVGMRAKSYAGCHAFLADTAAHDCDCLILDVRLPDGSGLSLHKKIAGKGTPVVFMSAFGDIPMVVQAMRQGALDFLEKPVGAQALLDRIHEAVAHSAARRRERSLRSAVDMRVAQLTPREREVMGHMVQGKPSKAIAAALGISVRTVEHHRARVLKKMRVASLPALMTLLARANRQ